MAKKKELNILFKATKINKFFGDFQANDEVNLTLVEENGKVKVLVMSTSDMEECRAP